MTDDPWRSFLFGFLPSGLVTAASVVLLGVMVTRRRRLGTAAKPAVAGFALLAGAGVVGAVWDLGELVFDVSLGDVLEPLLSIVLSLGAIAGTVAAGAAVFAGRARS